MPMIQINTPTNPALGKSSSAIIQGGISDELKPFVGIGGAIVDQDQGMSIAGGTRLGRHVFIKGGEEQRQIAQRLRTERMNEYINELTGQGFTRVNQNKLQKKEGGYTTTVSLNWLTGSIDSSTEATSSSRSSRRAASDAGSKYMALIDSITSGKTKVAGGDTQGTLNKLKSNVNAYYGGQVYNVPQNIVNQETKKSSGGGSSSSSSRTTYTSTIPTKTTITKTSTGGSGSVSIGGTQSKTVYTSPVVSKVNVTKNISNAITGGTTNTKSSSGLFASKPGGTKVGNTIRNITSIFKKK